MVSSIVCSRAVVLFFLFIVCCCSHCLWGLIVILLFCFAVAFCPFKFWFHLAGEERELGALVCSEFPVASVLWIFLVVPWVGLSYVVVAFPGHTHLPVGLPIAS